MKGLGTGKLEQGGEGQGWLKVCVWSLSVVVFVIYKHSYSVWQKEK